jgi:hypothetical protein
LTDPEFETVEARLIYYTSNDYQKAIDDHYRDHPDDEGAIFILLMPKGGKFKLRGKQ